MFTNHVQSCLLLNQLFIPCTSALFDCTFSNQFKYQTESGYHCSWANSTHQFTRGSSSLKIQQPSDCWGWGNNYSVLDAVNPGASPLSTLCWLCLQRWEPSAVPSTPPVATWSQPSLESSCLVSQLVNQMTWPWDLTSLNEAAIRRDWGTSYWVVSNPMKYKQIISQ